MKKGKRGRISKNIKLRMLMRSSITLLRRKTSRMIYKIMEKTVRFLKTKSN